MSSLIAISVLVLRYVAKAEAAEVF
jgi:hypothetical protein